MVTGDLALPAVPALTPPAAVDDDQAFQNALEAVGLAGWPSAADPRLSRMWTPDRAGGWLFTGLLLESPEPVHRPGRLEVADLEAGLGFGTPLTFDLFRRDQLGARLLFLSSAPARLSGPQPRLILRATSRLDGAATPVDGMLSIPLEPSFAGEP